MINSPHLHTHASHARPLVLAIAGPSCTGKSSLARRLSTRFGAGVLSLESYYKDLPNLSLDERSKQNYDSPASLDNSLLERHVADFIDGRAVDVPVYDFAVHRRIVGEHETLRPGSMLIVEGILVLHWASLRKLFDLSIYLDAPSDVCLQRRRVRDIVERQRSNDFILEQYEKNVEPMAELYVRPSRHYASNILDARQPIDALANESFAILDQVRPQRLRA